MAGIKKKAGEEDIYPVPELIYRINRMKNKRDKALASFIYMSGCRISEILGTKKNLKDYLRKDGKYVLEDGQRVYENSRIIEIPPLKKENIEIRWEANLMLIHNVPCLKRQNGVPKRIIPIYISAVKEFFDLFYAYFKDLEPGTTLFSIGRQRAWQITKGQLNIYNHQLIHNRITHFVANDNLSNQDLKLFRGWSSTIPADNYVHIRWQDLAKKMGVTLNKS